MYTLHIQLHKKENKTIVQSTSNIVHNFVILKLTITM